MIHNMISYKDCTPFTPSPPARYYIFLRIHSLLAFGGGGPSDFRRLSYPAFSSRREATRSLAIRLSLFGSEYALSRIYRDGKKYGP